MVVVGSGAIGSEFANFYQTIGTKVTLVEFFPGWFRMKMRKFQNNSRDHSRK